MIFLPHELSKSHLLQLFIEYATIHQAILVDFLLPCVVGFAACWFPASDSKFYLFEHLPSILLLSGSKLPV